MSDARAVTRAVKAGSSAGPEHVVEQESKGESDVSVQHEEQAGDSCSWRRPAGPMQRVTSAIGSTGLLSLSPRFRSLRYQQCSASSLSVSLSSSASTRSYGLCVLCQLARVLCDPVCACPWPHTVLTILACNTLRASRWWTTPGLLSPRMPMVAGRS